MRFDKLTTKFQQALNDAQSIAVGNDNPSIEPQHLLQALLNQDDGGTASLLAHAGANLSALKPVCNKPLNDCPRSRTMRVMLPSRATSTIYSTSPINMRKSAAMPTSPARCFCWRWPTTKARPAACSNNTDLPKLPWSRLSRRCVAANR